MKEEYTKKNKNRGTNLLLHVLQHGCFVLAAVMIAFAVLGSYVMVDTHKGTKMYQMTSYGMDSTFEETELFGKLLGNSVSDIVCYGAIRAQMETDGSYDPMKEIDVTAFANRYEGLQEEYITANYYLQDLIDWENYGFEYEDVSLSGEEVISFLSRYRTVTTVDLSKVSYGGGIISYMNSDAEKYVGKMEVDDYGTIGEFNLGGEVRLNDVSGNMLISDEAYGESVSVTILKNRYQTVDDKKIENHVSSFGEYDELCQNIEKAAEDLAINYDEYQSYHSYYDAENSSVVYYIRRTIGNQTEVYSNQQVKSTKMSALKELLKNQCSQYVIYDAKNRVYETNTKLEESTLRYLLNGYEYAYPEDTQILIGIKTEQKGFADAFTQARSSYDQYTHSFLIYLVMAMVCILFYLLLTVMLTIREGKGSFKENGEKVVLLKGEDKIPTEIMMVFMVAMILGFIFLTRILLAYISELMYSRSLPAVAGAYALCCSLIVSFFYYSTVRRCKAGTLWKNSLLKRILDRLKRTVFYLYDHAGIVLRVWIPFGGFVLLQFFACFSMFTSKNGFVVFMAFVLMLFADIAVGLLLYKTAIDRQQILQGIKQINDGDMEHKIEEEKLHGDNLVLAQAVNNIGDGIRNAVATSMKDERLKADLITNVSHDIKTPLTSIINYVDLIKRENVENPKVREYINVLDGKSQRLKQLTDDLVEASKISSGNIVLQWEKINLVELLNQTIGEFSEKFEEKMLTPVFRVGKSSIYIEADSRRIWRVIENLFHNIFKYAMSGTRVYIDIKESETEKGAGQVTLSIMNISANPIKVNADELTERFIRGDESRTTEGSGLGLSIAKNLTEVQKGKFEIVVDGDLFKVILTFPLFEEKQDVNKNA